MTPQHMGAVHNGTYYEHFGIHPVTASMYGHVPDDIVKVELTLTDDQTRPERSGSDADYWGWFDNERQKLTMVYPQYFLLHMCFTYGIDAAEKRGQGKAYRLHVKEAS